MDATKKPLTQHLRHCWLAVTLSCFGLASADGMAFPDISECGLTTNQPPLPAYRVKNLALPKHSRGGATVHDGKITLQLEGHGELPLQQYLYEPDPQGDVDREAEVDWDYVASRRVALGWLAGTTNLLLVSWRDLSSSHGTGHYEMQWYLVAQIKRGSSSVLLKKSVCSSGRARDMNQLQGTGIGQHYFTFDSIHQMLIDRMTFSRDLEMVLVYDSPPLYHPAKDAEPKDTFVAAIRETIVHRYRYQHANLASTGVEMFYTAQALDSPRSIAAFYFGPLAPASVILKANPQLQAQYAKEPGYEGGWFRLPAGTAVRIPLPEEWISRFYE